MEGEEEEREEMGERKKRRAKTAKGARQKSRSEVWLDRVVAGILLHKFLNH